jgi:ABC-type proline/glycine betaine transport system permease subunit
MLAGLLAFGVLAAVAARRRGADAAPVQTIPEVPREQWTMPSVALLARPKQSAGRKAAMLALEAYLLLAIVLLIVKAVQLAGG